MRKMTPECSKQPKRYTPNFKKNYFVNDEKGRNVSQLQDMQKIIENHFRKHFKEETVKRIEKLTTTLEQKLEQDRNVRRSDKSRAVQQMPINKASEKYNINLELIKFAPRD